MSCKWGILIVYYDSRRKGNSFSDTGSTPVWSIKREKAVNLKER